MAQSPWPRNLLGAALLAGSAAFLWAALEHQLAEDFPAVLAPFISAMMVIGGLWALRAERLMGRHRPAVDWNTFWMGSLVIAVGCFLMAVSVADPRDEAFHAPRWVVTVAGMVFGCFGAAALRSAVLGKEAERPDDPVAALLVTLILTGFGVICSFAAFGPGEREFEGGLSLGPLSFDALSGEIPGRIAFGIAAVLIDAIALWAWVATALAFLARRKG